MSDLSQAQIEQILHGMDTMSQNQERMGERLLEFDDRRKQQKQQTIIQWIGAVAAIVVICQTMLVAFEKAIKANNETIMIHIENIGKKLEQLDKKALRDNDQDVSISNNSQAINNLKERLDRINP